MGKLSETIVNQLVEYGVFTQMLHGAGILTYIETSKMAQSCG